MSNLSLFVDAQDASSVESLIDRFAVRNTEYEDSVRKILALHDRAFTLRFDLVSRPQLSSLDDCFTFDTLTDELIMFTEESNCLVDALLEMAMYMRGFNTTLSGFDEWKTQFTAGAWRHVRHHIKAALDLDSNETWMIELQNDNVERYNHAVFETLLFFAGRPDVRVQFPAGSNALVVDIYQRLAQTMREIANNIGLEDAEVFNRRLQQALNNWENQMLMPNEPSTFDDLFGPDGLNDRYFDDRED